MKLQQRLSRIVYLLSLALLLALATGWFKSRGVPIEFEDPLRIVLGGMIIFFIPGLIWGEFLGLHPTHSLETLAWSFIISLSIEFVAMLAAFMLAVTITAWVYMVLGASLAGLVLLLLRFRKGEPFRFAEPLMSPLEKSLKENVSHLLILVTMAFIARGAYAWGEDLFSINGEKLLHILFVMKYYSLPLVLPDLSVGPHVAAANMVNFWEFLIAGWARLIHCDPLPLFFRARFIIPLAGLPSMFLLTKSIIDDDRKAEGVFWTIILMVLGWWVLLSPSSLDYIKDEHLRGALAFMGTVHHADSAMDMLIAPCAALLFLLVRRTTLVHVALFAALLSITFLWHVREFFQIAMYTGILGLSILLFPSEEKKKMLKCWSVSIITIVAVAVMLLVAMKLTVPHTAFGYDEMTLKKTALSYAVMGKSFLGVRNLFCFPSILALSSTQTPGIIMDAATVFRMIPEWHVMPWLAVSLMAALALAFLGIREERRFSLFYLLLWFLSLSWTFSMLIIFVLTYSEIMIGTPRILYIFSYIITGLGFTLLARYSVTEDRHSYYPLIFPLLVILSAVIVEGLMKKGFFIPLSYLLSSGALVAFVALVVPAGAWKRLKRSGEPSMVKGGGSSKGTDKGSSQKKGGNSSKQKAGASSLHSGASSLHSGASSLPGGASSLPGGASSLPGGASSLHSGASSLPGGASSLHSGASSLPGGASNLPGGASSLHSGASSLPGGAGRSPWPGAVYLLCLLSLLPFLWKDYGIRVSALVFEHRSQPDWYGDKNPFGYSKELIAFIRGASPKSTFLADPFGKSCLFVYAPHYAVIMPSVITTLISAEKARKEAKQGKHPLFRPETLDSGESEESSSLSPVNHEEVCRWLETNNVQYILAEGNYYRKLSGYFLAHPESYRIVFENKANREVVAEFKGAGR
ncbi:MAG: hypothetical protein AB2L14_31940 [Candidatus Xenobiia bacterium LiM19]